ncbi:MAG: hypothetical protein HY069_01980, partial [Chlamydiia bacterium]|nr:hypothetical protein [Chlamydiia bacterium]
MKKCALVLLSFFALPSLSFAASLKDQIPNRGNLQVVPVTPSPDPDRVDTTIFYPKPKE